MDTGAILREFYADSGRAVIIADEKMSVVWCNQPEKCRGFDPCRLRVGGAAIELPLTETVTAEYPAQFGEGCAVEIQPISEGAEGYLLVLYSCDDIERLADRSGHLKFKANFLGNIRNELSQVLFMLEANRDKYLKDGDIDYLNIEKEARYRIMRTFAATVNLGELSKYYNGFFAKEAVCVSDAVEKVCGELDELFDSQNCVLTADIAPGIYLMMNSDRVRAAVCNLLINAYMYCAAEKKELSVVLSSDGKVITLSVCDNGGSVTAAELERCKAPFAAFRSFGEHESLGIAVAAMFCESVGGELSFECSKGEYTKAVMKIPFQEFAGGELKAEQGPCLENPYDVTNCIIAKAIDPMK